MLQVSQNSEDLIVSEEVGSRATFEKKYRHPEWPQGASGITVGIGYDVGYQTVARVRSDWAQIPSSMVDALASVTGLKGASAESMLSAVKSKVDISFDQGMEVFNSVDKPRWLDQIDKALPNCDKLAPDCVGVLWSLAYNRGCSFNLAGDRYVEMHNIKLHMAAQEFDKIPGELRSMKRLWSNGLVGRREREAKLFERGLAIMHGQHTEETAPRVRTRSEEVKRNAQAAGAATGTATGSTAHVTPKSQPIADHSGLILAAAILIGAVAGFGIIMYLGRHKQLPKADPSPELMPAQ